MVEPDVVAALGLRSHELISLVGAGGKTTLLFRLGDQLGGRVILTTTTRMASRDTRARPVLIAPSDSALRHALDDQRVVVVWKAISRDKAIGVSPETADGWLGLADHVVVEADGSRRLPFKAPAAHEPVIPSLTTLTCVMMGSGALGQVIADVCHRPGRVAQLAKCSPSDVLTPARAAMVICHPHGGMRGQPAGSRSILVITGVSAARRAAAREVEQRCRPVLGDVVMM